MKVIDLLNKIANGEEVPKKIKIGVSTLTYNKIENNYQYDEGSDEYYGDYLIHWFELNDEVEIIEDKIPEKIKDKYCSQISKVELAQKYNEIIDYLKSKGE